jgi:hypothetical protein
LKYGVNTVHWDEWSLVGLYEYVENNGLTLISIIKRLFSQHNEHRMFFPQIILLIGIRLSHLNSILNMYIIQLMVIAVYVISIRYFVKNRSAGVSYGNSTMLIFIMLSGLACFNYIQFGNFLMGWQVVYYMPILGTVISLYYFQEYILHSHKRFCVLSILSGIIASFSALHGLFIWLVIFVLAFICLVSKEKAIIKLIIPYFIFGSCCFFVYFYGWKRPFHAQELNYEYNIYFLIKYFLGSIGGMYTGIYSKLTVILGGATTLFSILLILVFYFNKKIKEVLFPLGLIVYSYGVLSSIAIGRADFGLSSSVHSRYMTFSVFSYLGIIMLVYRYFMSDGNIWRIKKYTIRMFVFITMLFSILLLHGNFKGLWYSKIHKDFLDENNSILMFYEEQPLEKLSRIFPFKTYEDAYTLIGKMYKYQLNIFSNKVHSYNEIPISRLNDLKKIKMDHFQGINQESYYWDDKFIFTRWGAWVIDYVNQKSYTQVYMKVNGRIYRTNDHINSPDVAEYFDNRYYKNVRFYFSYPIENMDIGENSFSALVILNDGKTYYETDIIIIYKDEENNLIAKKK